jgi:thiol-disulfide isomerase/thioredoxin
MDSAGCVLTMGVTGGLIALAAALAAATLIGVTLRRRAGRFRAGSGRAGARGSGVRGSGAGRAAPSSAFAEAGALTEADLGGKLGERATLVQFSTAFCAPCRPTRQLLAQVAGMVDGVRHIEIDAVSRLDLAQRLRISSTPTVLVLDPDGGIVRRAVGLPRKADVLAALGSVIQPGASGLPPWK